MDAWVRTIRNWGRLFRIPFTISAFPLGLIAQVVHRLHSGSQPLICFKVGPADRVDFGSRGRYGRDSRAIGGQTDAGHDQFLIGGRSGWCFSWVFVFY